MYKDVGIIYKHIQSELSTLLIKASVISSSASSASSSIELTITSVSSVIDKKILFFVPKIPSRII